MKHTPEPWESLPEEFGKPYIRIRGTVLGCRYKIANVLFPDYPEPTDKDIEETRLNARRVVSCVNACKGIDTSSLESGVVAEMLSALEMVAGISRRLHPEEESRVRAAIALARGY